MNTTGFLGQVPLLEGLSERGLGFFLVERGLVEVLKDGSRIASLGAGGFFGEMSLLTDEPRSAGVVVREPTDCLVLSSWDFCELLAKRPDISVKLLEVVCRRLADSEEQWAGTAATGANGQVATGAAADGPAAGTRRDEMGPVEFLKQVPLFEGLTEEEITEVALAAQEREFPKGAFIVTQGSPGLGFYLLVDGKVQVLRNRKAVAELGPGGFFGEMSLLDEAPRSASIVALEPAKCLVLGSWDFRLLLKKKPEIGIKMLEVMSKRLRETNEKLGIDEP